MLPTHFKIYDVHLLQHCGESLRSFLGCLILQNIHKKLTTSIVVALNWEDPFELIYDACDFTIEVVFVHQRGRLFQAIYYASNTLNEAQVNCATTEKEHMVVFLAFDKFWPYLVGTKVIVYIVH